MPPDSPLGSFEEQILLGVLRTGADGALYGTTAAWLWLFDNTAPRPPLHVV